MPLSTPEQAMHAECPFHTPKSLRDFALDVLMIVVSVLIALGFEEAVQALHNRSNAAKARAQIEAELRGNLKETRDALAANRARLVRLSQSKGLLADAVRRNLPASDVRQAASQPQAANRAISYMPVDAQQRYAAAYALQREATAASQQAATMLMGGPDTRNTLVDLELDRAEPIDLLRLVFQTMTAQSTVQLVLRQTEAQLLRSLGEPAAGGAKP